MLLMGETAKSDVLLCFYIIYLFITRQYLRAIICDVFVNCLLLFGVYILFFNRFKLQFGTVVICYIQFRY